MNLAKQLDFLFEKGTFAEKRLLCETVFKRLNIEDGGIIKNPELNSPFGFISSVVSGSGCFQLGREDWTWNQKPCLESGKELTTRPDCYEIDKV